MLWGSVFLKGYGDPSLSTTSYQRDRLHISTASISSFVTRLKGMGVTQVMGNVVGDASWFDGQQTVSGWKSSFVEECGPLCALSVNEGFYKGVRVQNPARHAARMLILKLEAAGIDVAGGPRSGRVPQGSQLAVTALSAPLSEIVRPMLKNSDNFFAEMLLKGLGRDFGGAGSTAAGLAVSRTTLAGLGVPAAGYRLADGSGLSYANRLSAGATTKLLRVMRTLGVYGVYWRALSVAGRDGTLRLRMRGTPAQGNLHGKTGTLNIASCLSGYVTTSAGHGVAFAMLTNGSPVNVWSAQRAQDAIAVAIARSRL